MNLIIPGVLVRQTVISQLFPAAVISLVLAAAVSGMSRKPPAPPYAPGEILVKFQDSVDSERAADIIRQEGGTIQRILGQTAVYLVTLPEGTDVMEAVERFSRYQEVRYAEPNYHLTPLEKK
jgi:hypothetical protein